jgi:hypothetical protein
MFLDKLHCCNFASEPGAGNKGVFVPSNMNPGRPASIVGKFQQTDNIVEPARNLVQGHALSANKT